jgi:nitrous oxide reductase accessory protein NosL
MTKEHHEPIRMTTRHLIRGALGCGKPRSAVVVYIVDAGAAQQPQIPRAEVEADTRRSIHLVGKRNPTRDLRRGDPSEPPAIVIGHLEAQ